MARKKSYEQRAMELEKQIEVLRERRRKALAHARYAIGELVIEQFQKGWKSIDLYRLEDILGKNAQVLATCVTDEIPVSEAMD